MAALIRLLLIVSLVTVPGTVEGAGGLDEHNSIPRQVIAPNMNEFPRVFGYSITKGLFCRRNLVPAVVGTIGTLALLPFDEDISDSFRDEFNAFGKTGHIIGNPAVLLGATGVFLITSRFTENERYRAFAFTLTEGMAVSYALLYPLKLAVGRTRPNEENNRSFPSGHSANTFTLATVADHYYGRKIGVPLYIMTGLVAASRIEKGKHFPSDVVFGATLGYICARSAIYGTEHVTSTRSWSLLPSTRPQRIELSFCMQF